MSAPQSIPSPQLIFDTLGGHQRAAALKAAIELEVFSAIGKDGAAASSIAKKTSAHERGIRILCDGLVAYGLLTKADQRYGLTAESAFFLDRGSPAYLGSIAAFLSSDVLLEACGKLTDSVRKGGTALDRDSTADENPMWVNFARSMAPMMMMPAEAIAQIVASGPGPMRVLDVAAGHGIFGLSVARRNPAAQVTAQDWASVLQVAQENAQRFGVQDRFRKLEGNAFSVEFGDGWDLVLFTNFLHHFDTATCEQLTRKAYAALKPGGKLGIVEFVPNDDRVSPPPAATFALTMLATTPAGDTYTYAQLERICAKAGFATVERHDLHPTPQTFVLATK
jgi:ubiquinone/menaquinone biosynthesis C-methylase UbiE